MKLFYREMILFFTILFMCEQIRGQCVDEKGLPVDWAIIYKLPKHSEHHHLNTFLPQTGDDYIKEGLGYFYMTSKSSENSDGGWIKSELSVKDVNSLPGKILGPLYNEEERNSNLFYMLYNDEHPDGHTRFNLGHTKGVLALNESGGYWLVHSVPKYPPTLENNSVYDYPHTGQMYGQTFLCISLNTPTSADQIGLQMMYNQPYLYSTNVPKWVEQKYPNLSKAAHKKYIRKSPFHSMVSIKSFAGLTFTSFAKTEKFGKDLYADFVAPFLQTNLMVETWPNGPGKMNSSCDLPFHVLNVDALDFKTNPDVDFVTKKDHAKWAVSFRKTNIMTGFNEMFQDNQKYVCIGDINRMNTQKKRGGGTVCFQNAKVWKAFTGIVKLVEPCTKPN